MLISCLYITYNRSDLLEESFSILRKKLHKIGLNVEYVVADDASDEEHVERIRRMPFDEFVLGDKNVGLGGNCNRGLKACSGELVLQMQDDWRLVRGGELIAHAVMVLQDDPEIGIVQLRPTYSDLPIEVRHTRDGVRYEVYANDHLPWIRGSGLRPYSDNPHIKTRAFIEGIGAYTSGVPMEETELEYKKRVANQHQWRVAGVPAVFERMGGSYRTGLPPSMSRRMLGRIPLVFNLAKKIYLKSDAIAARTVYELGKVFKRRGKKLGPGDLT